MSTKREESEMSTKTVADEIFPVDPYATPSKKELAALEQFCGLDETRPHFCKVWRYEDGPADRVPGSTMVATDGHTICIRRTGTDLAQAFSSIRARGAVNDPNGDAVRWDSVISMPYGASKEWQGFNAIGFNAIYLARLVLVQKATGERLRESIVQEKSESVKNFKVRREIGGRVGGLAFRFPKDVLAACYWKLDLSDRGEGAFRGSKLHGIPVRWEGLIMPVRL
jgi:hypothetical protein